MRVVTAETMRALDRRAIEQAGIPGVVLMENAGRAVFTLLCDRFGPPAGRRFNVYCGTGNNGGDGFVVARYLHLSGATVSLIVAGEGEKISGDARIHYDILLHLGLKPRETPLESAVQVDALLGTGAGGAPRDPIAPAIRRMNRSGEPIISVDIPSGVDSDTGATPGEAVRAMATVTFGYPKLGMFLPPGADCVGELVVSDIGFDWRAASPETPYSWIRPDSLRPLLPPRPREAFKNQFGHVLVVGGSRGMSGAPTMAALAAMRAGAGLVTVAAPASAQSLIAGKLNEAMTVALPERDGALCQDALEPLRTASERATVLCIGPGATHSDPAVALLQSAIREMDLPAVIDADGLNALAREPQSLHGRTAPVILTPHPGECGRLLGTDAGIVQGDRVTAVREAARRYRAVVVLKGARTLVSDGRSPSVELPVAVNTAGNPGMATGGSGDSLTGIAGAMLARGLDAFDAACAAVYLHGRAGDLARDKMGETGLIAGDIIESVPQAIRELEECE